MDKHTLGEVDSDALARLAKLGEALTDDQVDELVQLSEDRQDGKISRREFAKAVGALGLGGLAGGGGAASMTGTAKADASTTDADGNVGRPNNRVDVFADGLDSKTVSTEKQDTGKVHELGPDDDLSSAVSDYSGEVIDLAGRTFPRSSLFDIPSNTTLRNGTIKQADGANAQLLRVPNGNQNVTLRNITIDTNSPNNTLQADTVQLLGSNCDYINLEVGPGSGSGTNVITMRGDYSEWRGGEITTGGEHVSLGGYQNVYHGLTIDDLEEVRWIDFDNIVAECMLTNNKMGAYLTTNWQGDYLFAGNFFEDNTYGTYVDTDQKAYHQSLFANNHYQGSDNPAVLVAPGGLAEPTARCAWVDNTYKRNRLGDNTGEVVKIEDGIGTRISPAQATNRNDATAIDARQFITVANSTDTYVELPGNIDKSDFPDGLFSESGTRTRINGVSEESANAETPTPEYWTPGEIIDFTDTGDGSGTGVYTRLIDGSWVQIGT